MAGLCRIRPELIGIGRRKATWSGPELASDLIEQNERKHQQLPSPRSATTFHIDDGDVDHHRHHREIRRRFASSSSSSSLSSSSSSSSPPTSRASSSPTSPSLSPIPSPISSASLNCELSSCSASSSSVSWPLEPDASQFHFKSLQFRTPGFQILDFEVDFVEQGDSAGVVISAQLCELIIGIRRFPRSEHPRRSVRSSGPAVFGEKNNQVEA